MNAVGQKMWEELTGDATREIVNRIDRTGGEGEVMILELLERQEVETLARASGTLIGMLMLLTPERAEAQIGVDLTRAAETMLTIAAAWFTEMEGGEDVDAQAS